jgi:hypothetical protein
MQKVVGSNPISRSEKAPPPRGFFFAVTAALVDFADGTGYC